MGSRSLFRIARVACICFFAASMTKGQVDDALKAAAASGNAQKVKEILAAGGDPNASTAKGFTVLMAAAGNGHADVVALLLAKGADVDARESEIGATGLLLVAGVKSDASPTGDRVATAKALIAGGADIEARDRKAKATSLMAASMAGYLDVVKVLVEAGADVNSKGLGGGTALFGAAAKGHRQVVRFLIDQKADVNTEFENGLTPLQIARAMGHTQVVQILEAAGGR